MPRLGVVVIHMHPNFKIQLMAGNDKFSEMPTLKPLVPFDDSVITFLDKLSGLLMNHPQGRDFPEIITFGFYVRKSSITKLKRSYVDLKSNVGRGVSFHIAPSNVPINFAYSLLVGLLSGNACVVRVSSKSFPQTDIVSNAICKLLDRLEFAELKRYVSLVRYERDSEINNFFSNLCDVRVIWGGDDTIAELRKSPLPPRSFDITFADRYSFCIIKAPEYLNIQGKKKIAYDFYNDTYLFDQNACSAPRLIYWVGGSKDILKAKEIFWKSLHEVLLEKKYTIQSMTAINKYSASCNAVLDYNSVALPIASDNLISRIELKSLYSDVTERTCAGGSYFEYSDQAPDKLLNFVSRKFQTLTYIGFKRGELVSFFAGKGIVGLDRIVPCGRASAFGLIWDGYDLIRHMSRVVSIE
jgi:hypothetical protein